MAAFDDPRAHHFALTARIGQGVAGLKGAVVHWHEAVQTRNALSKLSDRELADIGLCRGDIDIVAGTR
ncbi:DUF1127 domain-containing protein [Sediminimonas sp.]|jgi:uncharacterized protein YjiS (DUF1127 family)|uniref:DUF1127 domain-containing protein n=1 Tax=Sediminimonas sp. TaxID=2823379 RepID=UPI002600D2E0|nr:DUF1127 domain-containing protein [Sediminimonas sp.]